MGYEKYKLVWGGLKVASVPYIPIDAMVFGT